MSARQEAIDAGEKTYDGRPCYRCGTTLKHTINASCVQCANERSRVFNAKKREEVKAKRQAAQQSRV